MAAMASSATLMQSLTLSEVMRALRLDHSPASVKSLQPDSSRRTTPCICSSITSRPASVMVERLRLMALTPFLERA